MSNEITTTDRRPNVPTEQAAVLVLYLESLIGETMSRDMLDLAAMRTMSRVLEVGLDVDMASETLNRIMAYAEERRQKHPFASLF